MRDWHINVIIHLEPRGAEADANNLLCDALQAYTPTSSYGGGIISLSCVVSAGTVLDATFVILACLRALGDGLVVYKINAARAGR